MKYILALILCLTPLSGAYAFKNYSDDDVRLVRAALGMKFCGVHYTEHYIGTLVYAAAFMAGAVTDAEVEAYGKNLGFKAGQMWATLSLDERKKFCAQF